MIALKNAVEIYAWAPKPYHKFMAFKVSVDVAWLILSFCQGSVFHISQYQFYYIEKICLKVTILKFIISKDLGIKNATHLVTLKSDCPLPLEVYELLTSRGVLFVLGTRKSTKSVTQQSLL